MDYTDSNPYGFIDFDDSTPQAKIHFLRWKQRYPDMIGAKLEFISKLAETGRPYEAAKSLNIPLRILTEWRRYDPAFDEVWAFCFESIAQMAMDEAFRRAVEGIDEDVYYEGEVVGKKKVYSDSLLSKILAAYNPKQFSEKGRMEVSGPDGGPITLEDGRVARESVMTALEGIAKKLSPPSE